MKRHLAKITGLAILALCIQTSGFAQQDSNQDGDDNGAHKYDEIIIRHKGDKDAKVTIEIKDGDVLVNGKPVSEYDDSTLSIHRRKVRTFGNTMTFTAPEIAQGDIVRVFPNQNLSGAWSYDGNSVFRSNRAMLGVTTEKNSDGNGAKVTQLTKGSAAEKMGLKVGDVITKVDDEEITDFHSLSKVIGSHDPGDKVTVTFMREGKEQKATGELGKAKDITMEPFQYKLDMPDMKALQDRIHEGRLNELSYLGGSPKFGIRAQDAEDGKGVKVLDVDDESTAAKAGIKEGDIITRFDGKEVNSVTALTDAAAAAKEKINVKVTIVRDGKTQELDVKVPRRLRTADL